MNTEIKLTNFPKIECPFVRKKFCANKEDIKKYGNKYQIRPYDNNVYLATKEIKEHYEWVFNDPSTIATEKLDGSNFKVVIKNREIDTVQNRANAPINILKIEKRNFAITEGIINAIVRGHIKEDGEYAGELLGPKLQGNPYKLVVHEWYPFAEKMLVYKSFCAHTPSYDGFSIWFKDYLYSLFYARRHKVPIPEAPMAEGVVFYNLNRKALNKTWRAKVRRDMFPWFYDRIRIENVESLAITTHE